MPMRLALKLWAEAAVADRASAPPIRAIVTRFMGLSLLARGGGRTRIGRPAPRLSNAGARIGPAGGARRVPRAGASARPAALRARVEPGPILGDRLLVRRERQRARQAGEREVAGLDRVVAGLQAPAGRGGRVEDEHGAHPRIVDAGVDAQQPGEAGAGPRLLAQ